MAEHRLKTDPVYFERVLSGEKTFEIRRDDRGFQAGDSVVLYEYDRTKSHDCDDPTCRTKRASGREVLFRIGFVAKGTLYGLALGEYAILSLLPARAIESDRTETEAGVGQDR